MASLLIIGAGGHGKVVADAAIESQEWSEIVFLDDAWPARQENGSWHIHGKILQSAEWLQHCSHAVVAMGNNRLRTEIQATLIAQGFRMATVIHPSAQISRHAKIGQGSVVFANAVINVDAVIGDAAIINTAATVDHDCRLGNGVHIAPGAHLGGGVLVGDLSWVGIGSSVRHYLSIGTNTTIGAGAVVVSSIEDNITAVGSPARPITTN